MAFLAHELRIQARSLRFRAVAGGWVAAASLPAAATFARRNGTTPFGAATYLAETLTWLVPLTIAGSFVLAADGLLREREQQTWSTLSLCGVGSAGYVLRRWGALLLVLLGVSLLPVAVAGVLAVVAGEHVSWVSFAAVWLLRVAPVAALWSAIGLGFGTVGGGLFAGTGLLALATLVSLSMVNRVLFHFRLHVDPPALAIRGLLQSAYRMQGAFSGADGFYDVGFPVVASAAPPDWRVQAEQALGTLGPTAALAALALGWAVLMLRRTRPDVQPWTVREGHSLGTFVRLASRLRERFAWDAGLAPRDRLTVVVSCCCALVAFGGTIARDSRFVHAAAVRFALAEDDWPGPTSRDVRVRSCRLAGRVGGDGEVRVASTFELGNAGAAPQRQLAMVLSPSLRVESLQAAGRGVSWSRRGERLAVTLDPPLRPGDALELRAAVAGRPSRTVFALPEFVDYGGYLGFHRSFGRYRRARFAEDLFGLEDSFAVRGVSPTRVALAADELMPVPRYTPFELVGGEEYEGARPRPEESLDPVPIGVDLATPPALWLADGCGHVASGGRLAGECVLPLPGYGLRGGTQVVEPAGALTVALLPGHRQLARTKLGDLDEVAAMVREVWPDEDLFGSTVLVELPGEETFLPDGMVTAFFRTWGYRGTEPRLGAQGRLLLLPEIVLLAGPPLPPAKLAAQVVGARLLGRRPIAPEQTFLFTELVASFAEGRAGFAPRGGAVVPATQLGPGVYEKSLLEASASDYSIWLQRLPALLVDLTRRIGEEAVRRGLAAFLARHSAGPGTLEELVGDWERASGVSLAAFYGDYLAGKALPVLDLADVTFLPGAEGWVVRGRVVNTATGEARCTVALTTEVSRSSVEVTVGSGGSAPFAFTSAAVPRVVLLDPEQTCHRYRPLVPIPIERVDYRGVGRG
jgi:hypothetical protein